MLAIIGSILAVIGAVLVFFIRRSSASVRANRTQAINTSLSPSNQGSQQTYRYTVKSGDFLGKIASKFSVSVDDIVKINNLDNPNDIRVGQVLLIPVNDDGGDNSGGGSGGNNGDGSDNGNDDNSGDNNNGNTPDPVNPQPHTKYTVKSGDFLSKIATRFGVSTSDIVKINNLDNPNDIRVGQVLLIPVSDDGGNQGGGNGGNNDNGGNNNSDGGNNNGNTPDPVNPQPHTKYTVKSGDFLSKIATRFGVTTSDIVKANNLDNPNDIRVGQVLLIPVSDDGGNQGSGSGGNNGNDDNSGGNNNGSSPDPVNPQPHTKYTVKSGDFLSKIATRFGVSTSDIVKINNLDNPNDIRVGQVLLIPVNDDGGGSGGDNGNDDNSGGQNNGNTPDPVNPQPHTKYTVKSGDFLSKIATRFGVSTSDIVKINNLDNPNDIRVGQVLLIPVSDDGGNQGGGNGGSNNGDGGNSDDNDNNNGNTQDPVNPQPHTKYTVKSGDFLSKIATRFGVSTSDIVKINNLDNPNDIRVGQVLLIPVSDDGGNQGGDNSGGSGGNNGNTPDPVNPQPHTKYTVKSGDFLSKIATRFGVSTSDIVKINNLDNPNDIRVGQVLLIPVSDDGGNQGGGDGGQNNGGNGGHNHPPSNDATCTEKFHRVSKVILRHEGGYVDDPNDAGGKTNKGIAWRTWQKFAQIDLGIAPTTENLKNLTDAQAEIIYRKRYWQPQGFCEIHNDRIGLMVYDWTITSGGAGKQVQRLLVNEFNQNIVVDGAIGPNTIRALNNVTNQDYLLSRITQIRKDYYYMLVRKRPANRKFIKGWINRVNDCLEVRI